MISNIGYYSFPRGKPLEKQLVHAIESVVIEWCHQIRDVLKKSSAQPLLEGKNPKPQAEIDFWKARCADLESVVDQVGEHDCVTDVVACSCSV